MKKFKVEFVESTTYVVDVLAESEAEAMDKAQAKWLDIQNAGMPHYHQVGDTNTEIGTVYDVTNTDDEFNP